MNMYNMIFGSNVFAPMLLEMLGTNEDSIPRFRDCYIREGYIVIFTRTGGGNRDWYESQERFNYEFPDEEYEGPFNEDLMKLPGYAFDRDDDFDNTYAEFFFKPSEECQKLIDQLSAVNGRSLPELFEDVESSTNSMEAHRVISVGKRILAKMSDSENP